MTPPLESRVVQPAIAESPNDRSRLPTETADEREPTIRTTRFTDLYGNEVNDAVATYTFDQSGSLYELHSPQTELPRLGIPKS